jgi:hypothetical protein
VGRVTLRHGTFAGARRRAPWITLFAGLICFGCSDPVLDTTRKTAERGTLGEEIYELIHADIQRDDERRAQGFEIEKDDFIGAIDHIFPPGELSYTQSFLVKLLPLYDDSTIPGATRTLASALERLQKDPDALKSLAAIDHRIGYVDHKHEEALIRRIAHYEKYPALMKASLRLVLEHDGLDESGNASPSESDALTRLAGALAKRLREIEITEDAEREIVLITDLLLKEDPLFADAASGPASPMGPPSLPAPGSSPDDRASIVARDPRGMAQIARASGQIPAPFVDVNPRDGLADVNVLGQFIDESMAPIDLPPFADTSRQGMTRDGAGRLLAPTGEPIFQYVNLDRTMLAGIFRDGRQLIADGVPMKAVRTIDTVLGERTTDGTYPPDNGVLDLAHAVGAAGDFYELPQALELLRVLLTQHEETLTWVDLETQATIDISDSYQVALRPGNTFFNDLMSTVRKILREPGLAEDLLVALQDPAIAGLPAVQEKMLGHKKDKITEADVAAGTMFDTPVDWTRPDTRDNQSLQQRTLHLIHDTKGASYQPSFIGIPLGFIFKIDDLAEFYIKSIIGLSTVPPLVSMLTGLPQTPTPQDLASFINKDQTFGNPRGHEGFDVRDNDGDALYACSFSGLSDVLKPLIQVFNDHRRLSLLFELFEDLHMHWATQQSGDYQDRDASVPRYSHLSGIRRYEPMLIDQFQHARTLDAARKLLAETKDLSLSNGQTAHSLLLKIARKLFDKDSALKARDGRHEVDIAGERITPLSPFDLIRAARARLKNAVKKSNQSQAEWDALVDAINRTLLKVERTGQESGRLKNPRALPIATLLLQFLEDRAAKHQSQNDITRWVTQDFEQHIQDAVTSKDLPALFDVIYAIDGDDELKDSLTALRDQLLAEDQGFQDLLVLSGDTLEAAKDASIAVGFMRYLGGELDPEKKLLFTFAALTKKSLDVDEDQHMLEVIRRALDDAPAGSFYGKGFTKTIEQTNRVNPLSREIVVGEDILHIMGIVSSYLRDDQHGVEKFYDLVSKRK